MNFTYREKEIRISNKVREIFHTFRQEGLNSLESGGIILGQVNKEIILINRVSIPNDKDKATKNSFNRDKDSAQEIINHEFTRSNGKTIYLGEWHTHPEENSKPSSVDIKMIKEQFKGNIINIDFLILIIIGNEKDYLGVQDEKSLQKIISCNLKNY